MARSFSAAALTVALLLPGCANRLPEDSAVAGSQVGNPDAAVAPLPPRTDTPAVKRADPAPGDAGRSGVAHTDASPGGAAPLVRLPGEPAPLSGDHDGMAGMAGMQHDEQSNPGTASAEASAPEEAAAAGPPTALEATGAWVRVMHPEAATGVPGNSTECGMTFIPKD